MSQRTPVRTAAVTEPVTSAVTAPVRRLGAEELLACLDLSADRDWLRADRKWRLLFEVGEVYGIDAPDGGLAGVVVSTKYGRQVAAISMMLVAKRHERQGLGRRLMTHALERSGTASACLTATDYGRPLYERLGFRSVSQCTSYSGPVRRSAGGSPRPVSRPAAPSDLPAVLALDAEVFGAPRTELLTRLQTFSEQFRVIEGRERIAGFAGAWRNLDGTVLGPVIAQDADTALALLSDLMSGADGPVRVVIDHRHPELIAWAGEQGLERGFTTAVMVHGEPLQGDPGRLFTPVMQALG